MTNAANSSSATLSSPRPAGRSSSWASQASARTLLLRHLAHQPGHVFRPAASFVAHPNPAALVPSGSTLLIDGLDELSATEESDPVYHVLGKLIEAGCPPFIMSCRAADWRGAVARKDISEDDGVPPRQMWLEPLSRDNAIEFLSAQIGQAKAETLISALEQREHLGHFRQSPYTRAVRLRRRPRR